MKIANAEAEAEEGAEVDQAQAAEGAVLASAHLEEKSLPENSVLIFRITLQISNNSELIFQAHLQLILDWRIILVRIIRQHTRQVIIIRQPTVRVTTPKLTVQRLAKLDCAKILTSSTTTSVDLDRVMDRLS